MKIKSLAEILLLKLLSIILVLPYATYLVLGLAAGGYLITDSLILDFSVITDHLQAAFVVEYGFKLKAVHIVLALALLQLSSVFFYRFDKAIVRATFKNYKSDYDGIAYPKIMDSLIWAIITLYCFGSKTNETLNQHVLFFVIFSFAFIAIIYTYINSIQIMDFWLKAFGYDRK